MVEDQYYWEVKMTTPVYGTDMVSLALKVCCMHSINPRVSEVGFSIFDWVAMVREKSLEMKMFPGQGSLV